MDSVPKKLPDAYLKIQSALETPKIVIIVPYSNGSDNIQIEIACKLYSLGVHTLLDSFRSDKTKNHTYMSVRLPLEPFGERTLYIKVDNAAKRLFTTPQEIRDNQFDFYPYLMKKAQEVADAIERVHQADTSVEKSILYDEAVAAHKVALVMFKNKKFEPGEIKEVDGCRFLNADNKVVLFERKAGKIGSGRSGVVYRVVDFATGRVSALKQFYPDRKSDEALVSKEIIDRGGIYGVQDFLVVPHSVEYLSRSCLGSYSEVRSKLYSMDACSKVMNRAMNPVPLGVILKECFQLVSGVRNLENQLGRIHLDLKLENFLCLGDGEMVVADLANLPLVSSVEDWLRYIQGNPNLSYTKNYNVEQDMRELRWIARSAKLCNEGRLSEDSVVEFLDSMPDGFLTYGEKLKLRVGDVFDSSLLLKFNTHLFKLYKQNAEQIAVFQLGNAFYSMIRNDEAVYARNNRGYARLDFARYLTIKRTLINILSPYEQEALTIACMLDPNKKLRPSIVEVQQVLERLWMAFLVS